MTVTPHPAMAVDMHVSETGSLIAVLRALAEETDDAQWLALKPDVIALLYLAGERMAAADAPIGKLVNRRAAS